MNPSPFPSPLDVVVHSASADWWVILAGLGPLAVLIAALLAFYINWRTFRQRTAADKTALDQKRESDAKALQQKTEADSRAEWWRRTQWALDRALAEDEGTKALGLATLDVLARSELARKEELELFDIAWKSVSGPEDNGDNADKRQALEEIVRQYVSKFETRPRLLRRPHLRIYPQIFRAKRGTSDPSVSGPDAVDSGGNIGDNETTDKQKNEELGQ